MNDRAVSTIRFLLEGNRRFAGGLSVHPRQDVKRRIECTAAQKPVAAILGCADSRVPPEVLFDCGIGDLFIVRIAGTALDNTVIASLEYAACMLHVPLVMVLGHTSCGAVTAALKGANPPGALGSLLEGIRVNCAGWGDLATDDIDSAVRTYTLRIAGSLRETGPVLRTAIERGDCTVVPACYSLTEGIVELLEPHPDIP